MVYKTENLNKIYVKHTTAYPAVLSIKRMNVYVFTKHVWI